MLYFLWFVFGLAVYFFCRFVYYWNSRKCVGITYATLLLSIAAAILWPIALVITIIAIVMDTATDSKHSYDRCRLAELLMKEVTNPCKWWHEWRTSKE